MTEKETFFQLLDYSNKLDKNQRCLRKEDRPAFKKLLNFFAIIEENLHWEVKNGYIELIEDFLNKIISADDFSIVFMRMFEKIGAKVYQLKIDLKENSFQSSEISKLLVKGKAYRYGIGDLLICLYGDYDNFNPNSSSRTDIQLNEEELRNCAKTALSEMQKETHKNNSKIRTLMFF